MLEQNGSVGQDGMLIFGTIVVIYKSNYLSKSQIGQSYYSQYRLYDVDTLKHSIGGKLAQSVPCCTRVGTKWSYSIFLYFPIS